MARISVSRKLITGFIIVSVFGLVIGGLAIIQANVLGENIIKLNELNIPQIQHLEIMKADQIITRAALWELRNPLYDRERFDSSLDDFQKAREEYAMSLESFTKLPLCDFLRTYLTKLNSEIAELREKNDSVINYAKTNWGKENFHADLYEHHRAIGQRESHERVLKSLQEMLEHAKEDNEDVRRDSFASIDSSRVFILGFGIASFAISLLFGCQG